MASPISSGAAALYQHAVHALEHPVAEQVPPCPVCGAETALRRFEVDGVSGSVVVCTDCGLGRMHPLPGDADLAALYPDAYYGEPGTKFQPLIERIVRLIAERHISFLSQGLAAGGRILDVGCGRGVVLGPLADRGFEVHGVEISAEAARGADPRAEIRIADELSDAQFGAGSFDQVILWHVLEHLRDPVGTLDEAHRILKPGGRLIVAVPNFESWQARWSGAAWFHLDLPRHLYHFPLRTLHETLRRTGFQLASTHHFSLRQNPFGWIQSVLNRFPSLPRNGLYSLLHRRAPGDPAPFDPRTRAWLWGWLVLGAPLALLGSVFEAALRSGATVHVVASRLDHPPRAGSQPPPR